ncbi:MAG: hypothetical protein ACLFVU_08015 [Phycisphaerae bacterium]
MKTALTFALASLLIATTAWAGPNLLDGDYSNAAKTDEGVRFQLDMGDKRVNWNKFAWSIYKPDKNLDLSKFDGLAVTARAHRKTDRAGVYLALKEADGSWYVHGWAADLNNDTNSGVALFKNFTPAHWISPDTKWNKFSDENDQLDVDKISAIAVGCVNPLGVGKLDFTLTRLEPATVKMAVTPDTEVTVTSDGKLLAFNGTDTIPAAIFGAFHLTKGHHEKYRLAMNRHIHHEGTGGGPSYGNDVTHMVIDTVGDRVRPSVRLTHKNWKDIYESYGKKYGQAAKADGRTAYVEFWNEPYLNWANRNRANFNPNFYDKSKAKEGGPVHIKHDGQVAPHLKWTKDYDAPPWNWCSEKDWRRGKDAKGKVYSTYAIPYSGMNFLYGGKWQPEYHPPQNVKNGESYTVKIRGKQVELTAFTPWHIYDETQFTYWSSKGMLKFYIEPMKVFFTEVKKANPDVFTIAGWGNRPSEDHWAGFHNLYKPTLDAAPDVIDAVCDHDYGGDPTKMAANYEVICAYMKTEHGRWVYGVNTECASNADPQAYSGAGTSKDIGKFTWTLQKILFALDRVPDKARAFAFFGMGGGFWSDGGEGVAMTLLKNLRGKLVNVRCDDPDIYAVAAIDGTDPQNPRPKDMPQRKELVLAVFNNADTARTVNLQLAIPDGLQGDTAILRTPAIKDGKIVIDESKSKLAGRVVKVSRKLPARGIVTVTVPVTGDETKAARVARKQVFTDAILHRVTADKPVTQTLTFDTDPSKANRAWVQFVAERLGEDEGEIVINGKTYTLPSAVTPENSPWLRRLPIDPADLSAETKVTIKLADPKSAGFLLGSCGIVVERDVE